MILKLIEEFKTLLPTKVVYFDCNPVLNFGGQDWNISIIDCWRVVKDKRFIGNDNKNFEFISKEAKSISIIDIMPQTFCLMDPVFIFDNGWQLEIFSAFLYDSWGFTVKENFYTSLPCV